MGFRVGTLVHHVAPAAGADPAALLPLGPNDIEMVNLTAGMLPANTFAGSATWRPDGSAIVFGLEVNPATNSEHVIAVIVFDTPDPNGCPPVPTPENNIFSVIAGGRTKNRSPRLWHPDY